MTRYTWRCFDSCHQSTRLIGYAKRQKPHSQPLDASDRQTMTESAPRQGARSMVVKSGKSGQRRWRSVENKLRIPPCGKSEGCHCGSWAVANSRQFFLNTTTTLISFTCRIVWYHITNTWSEEEVRSYHTLVSGVLSLSNKTFFPLAMSCCGRMFLMMLCKKKEKPNEFTFRQYFIDLLLIPLKFIKIYFKKNAFLAKH